MTNKMLFVASRYRTILRSNGLLGRCCRKTLTDVYDVLERNRIGYDVKNAKGLIGKPGAGTKNVMAIPVLRNSRNVERRIFWCLVRPNPVKLRMSPYAPWGAPGTSLTIECSLRLPIFVYKLTFQVSLVVLQARKRITSPNSRCKGAKASLGWSLAPTPSWR